MPERYFAGGGPALPLAGKASAVDRKQQCDAFSIGQDRVEHHARVLAGCLSAPSGQGGDGSGPRSGDPLACLQRLLSLRELWVREHC